MFAGRNTGKKLNAMRIVENAFDIIAIMSERNPIEVCPFAPRRRRRSSLMPSSTLVPVKTLLVSVLVVLSVDRLSMSPPSDVSPTLSPWLPRVYVCSSMRSICRPVPPPSETSSPCLSVLLMRSWTLLRVPPTPSLLRRRTRSSVSPRLTDKGFTYTRLCVLLEWCPFSTILLYVGCFVVWRGERCRLIHGNKTKSEMSEMLCKKKQETFSFPQNKSS